MQVIDGTNMVLGRAASQIAKRLLTGEEVHLINAEKMVIIGNPKQVCQRYITKRGIKQKANPEHSPKWSRLPHLLVKRMIRGMLPKKSSRGRDALRKLRVYTENPKNLEQNGQLEKAEFNGISKHVTIHELCRNLGYQG